MSSYCYYFTDNLTNPEPGDLFFINNVSFEFIGIVMKVGMKRMPISPDGYDHVDLTVLRHDNKTEDYLVVVCQKHMQTT